MDEGRREGGKKEGSRWEQVFQADESPQDRQEREKARGERENGKRGTLCFGLAPLLLLISTLDTQTWQEGAGSALSSLCGQQGIWLSEAGPGQAPGAGWRRGALELEGRKGFL